MSIPKIIHTVWFGGVKPELIRTCEKQRREKLGEWELIEWNETNVDMERLGPFALEMYRQKKWAFLSDVVRLSALEKFGGFYLDSDVFVNKDFDAFRNNRLILGFAFPCALSTSIIGCVAGHPVVRDLIRFYQNYEGVPIVNNSLFTWYFLKRIQGFRLTGETQVLNDGITVYDTEYFEIPSFSSQKGYVLNYALGSWCERENVGGLKGYGKGILSFLLGRRLYAKIESFYRNIHIKEFYGIYRNHKRGLVDSTLVAKIAPEEIWTRL